MTSTQQTFDADEIDALQQLTRDAANIGSSYDRRIVVIAFDSEDIPAAWINAHEGEAVVTFGIPDWLADQLADDDEDDDEDERSSYDHVSGGES